MNKNNDIIFIMEKNEKPYELTLDEAIGKKLNYMFGNLIKKKGIMIIYDCKFFNKLRIG